MYERSQLHLSLRGSRERVDLRESDLAQTPPESLSGLLLCPAASATHPLPRNQDPSGVSSPVTPCQVHSPPWGSDYQQLDTARVA